MSAKAHCIACGTKETSGVFTCEGCSQTFCLKHTNEHRWQLNNELDEIICQHDILYQTTSDSKQQSMLLLDRIDRWENEAIEKIHQAANKARQELQILAEKESGFE